MFTKITGLATIIIIIITGLNSWLRPTPSSTPAATQPGSCLVTKVVDGDTLEADCQGVLAKIRLIGVDTPEVVDPRKTVQCFGREASDFAKKTLSGQSVRLEADPSQGDTDKYGRQLRYVYLADGRLFNWLLISEGYAFEYTYNIPYREQASFKTAQKEARLTERGLWVPGVCESDARVQKATSASVSPLVATTTATTSAGVIKKSVSNICYEAGDRNYQATKNFQSFATMADCLATGARRPK
jgi:micrococcal nuclease